LKKALEIDPYSHDLSYQLSLYFAQRREADIAIKWLQHSMSSNYSHSSSWHLITLLLSSKQNFEKALDICLLSLQQNPKDMSLWLTRAALTEKIKGPDFALAILKEAFVSLIPEQR